MSEKKHIVSNKFSGRSRKLNEKPISYCNRSDEIFFFLECEFFFLQRCSELIQDFSGESLLAIVSLFKNVVCPNPNSYYDISFFSSKQKLDDISCVILRR